ncbi:MAG TPA: hypothetical protein VMR45_00445 [Patescibacteria group bacterium]|nr:hypothetical protein [Patescibacteria group bacterium]
MVEFSGLGPDDSGIGGAIRGVIGGLGELGNSGAMGVYAQTNTTLREIEAAKVRADEISPAVQAIGVLALALLGRSQQVTQHVPSGLEKIATALDGSQYETVIASAAGVAQAAKDSFARETTELKALSRQAADAAAVLADALDKMRAVAAAADTSGGNLVDGIGSVTDSCKNWLHGQGLEYTNPDLE